VAYFLLKAPKTGTFRYQKSTCILCKNRFLWDKRTFWKSATYKVP